MSAATESTKDGVIPMDTTADGEVDEKLYSRQLYVMGHEAQRRMMSSSCLLIGVSGLGVEIAKNVILAGISSLTLADPSPPTSFDLGGNFYLSEEDLTSSGRSRADICLGQLSELNQYVKVSVASVPDLSPDAILPLIEGQSCVVVSIPLPTTTLHLINEKCRASSACFIYTVTHSVFGSLFCDFGEAFVVSDKDGENPHASQVEEIIPENPAVVKVLEDQGRHNLETGDFVTFDRVKGMQGYIEPKKEYEVKVTGKFTFELPGCDFSSAKQPATQGYITQVKKPVTMSFRTLKECFEKVDASEFMMSDFAKMERPMVLHLAFRALAEFFEANNDLLSPGDVDQAKDVLNKAKALDKDNILGEKEERIILHLASGSKAILSPMCAALGGIVGQEVLKACSGKFTPVKQFLFLDGDECLPDELLPQSELNVTGKSRYDSQIAVFGKSLQDTILSQNYFLVGAGAIGCEMLKNWSLMGVGCGPNGNVHVTDMDRIEKSNLSRQFLFRNKDIDQFKSTTAANAAKAMNPGLNIHPYQEKVAADTEHIFGDDFYSKLTGVCTALDNVEARLYVDQRCVFYRLPMLESGTLGTKGNTQVVVPHITENYGATRDPPEKSIPVCTLKNFPNQIQHTLQWARDYFEGVFKQAAEDVNSYLDGTMAEQSNANQKLETYRNIQKTLLEKPADFNDCVSWARHLFQQLFDNQIRQLLYNFPEDQVTSTGTLFWSGSKRCPKPLTFNIDDVCEDAQMRNHLDFIVAAANLRAEMYGLEGRTDTDYFVGVLKDIIVPDFVPKDGVKIAANDAEAENEQSNMGDNVDDECQNIMKELPTPSSSAPKLTPIEFDKDIDEHMLFVTACSNLRAMNYSIPTEDTHRSRAIAGRIIPAIATTTALVTGLICLELYKIVGSPKKKLTIEAYKNGFLNLAIPFMTLSEPTPPAKTKALLKGKEWEWTAWDSLDMIDQGDITLAEFMEYFQKEYNLDISMLSHGVSILYSFFANKKKIEERKKMKMSEVVESVTKKEFPKNQLFIVFEIIANDLDTDEEVEIPYVKYKFR